MREEEWRERELDGEREGREGREGEKRRRSRKSKEGGRGREIALILFSDV